MHRSYMPHQNFRWWFLKRHAIGAAEAAARATADQEKASQWKGESGLADPLDMTFPDLDPNGGTGFGEMFPSGNSFAFPSLPSGLVYTGASALNENPGNFRNS